MRDPLFIDQWNPEIPSTQRIQYEQVEQTPRQIQKSLNESHDRIRTLTKANNAQADKLLEYKRRLGISGLKLWILGAAVVVQFAVIGWLVQAVLRLVK